jgi:hypothetical protein
MPTDFPNLIPHAVADEVIQSVADSASGVMQLATVVRAPTFPTVLPMNTYNVIYPDEFPRSGPLVPGLYEVEWRRAPENRPGQTARIEGDLADCDRLVHDPGKEVEQRRIQRRADLRRCNPQGFGDFHRRCRVN